MSVKNVMTHEVRVANPGMSLKDAAALMREADTGFLPVGENDRLVGTLTDRDIVIRAVAEGRDPSQTRVRDVMSEGILYCYEDDDEEDVADLMAEKQVRRLPVLNQDKRLVGVVSLGDIAARAGEEDAAGAALKDIAKDTGSERRM